MSQEKTVLDPEKLESVTVAADKFIAGMVMKTEGRANKYQKFNAPALLDVGFCFYETSLPTVKRAIESVKDHVRFIFAIDGKFEFFESNTELSSKAVRDYLLSISNVILVDYPNRKENEKRQQYLELAQKYMSDYLLILDADEFMTDECDWQLAFNEMAKHYDQSILPKIWGVIMRHGQKEASFPRLWQRPYLIQYMKTHNFFQFKESGDVYKSQITFPPMKGLYMKGDDKDRDADYIEKAYQYQKKLMEYEKPYKEQYRKIARNVSDKYVDNRLPGVPLS